LPPGITLDSHSESYRERFVQQSPMRTNQTCALAAIADAAFPRNCSGFLGALQNTSPKQS
jgi:hypothetical protein